MSVNFAGIVPNNYPVNTRILVDTNYVVNINLPATATTANSNNLNMLAATPFPTTESFNVQVSWNASATNGNSVTSTVVLQHASANADGTANTATWANIPTLSNTTIPQSAGSTAAGSATYKLPPGCLQFIRAQVTNPANTANVADVQVSLAFLF